MRKILTLLIAFAFIFAFSFSAGAAVKYSVALEYGEIQAVEVSDAVDTTPGQFSVIAVSSFPIEKGLGIEYETSYEKVLVEKSESRYNENYSFICSSSSGGMPFWRSCKSADNVFGFV